MAASRHQGSILTISLAAAAVAGVCTGAPAHATTSGDLSGSLTFVTGVNNGLQADTPSQTTISQISGLPRGSAITGLNYSPDGSRMVLESDLNGTKSVWLADNAGGDLRALAIPGITGLPAWSTDGRSLLVALGSKDAGGHLVSTLYRVAPDGGGLTPLFSQAGAYISDVSQAPGGDIVYRRTATAGPDRSPATAAVWHQAGGAPTILGSAVVSVDFAPDGSSVLLVQHPGTVAAPTEVDMITPDGATLTTLEKNGNDVPTDDAQALWSPDGRQFMYRQSGEFFIVLKPGATSEPGDFHLQGVAGPHAEASWQPKAAAPHPVYPLTIDRMGGDTRVQTAVDASRLEFADASSTDPGARKAACAVLTRSDNYADALSGSALAGEKRGPLLLTDSGTLDQGVLGELKRVLAPHATVYLLGGTGALSPAVEQAVAQAGFTVDRLQGADRYQTNLAITAAITTHPRTIITATGENYPDALAAGAYAATRTGTVVLLTHSDGSMDPAVAAYLSAAMDSADHPNLVEAGGQATTARERTFPAAPWAAQGRVTEAGGADRYETAARIAALFGPSHQTVALATGNGWADALAGGAVAGLNGAPLLLTNGLIPDDEATALSSNPVFAPREILVFGGEGAVPQSALVSLTGMVSNSIGSWTPYVDRVAPQLP